MFDRSDQAFDAPSGSAARAPKKDDDHGGSSAATSADLHSPSTDLHEVLTHAQHAHAAACALGHSATAFVRTTHSLLEHQVRERPAAALGVAAGVGFVVAGGLSSPAARSLVRFGSRAVVGFVVQELIGSMGAERDAGQQNARFATHSAQPPRTHQGAGISPGGNP